MQRPSSLADSRSCDLCLPDTSITSTFLASAASRARAGSRVSSHSLSRKKQPSGPTSVPSMSVYMTFTGSRLSSNQSVFSRTLLRRATSSM